MGLQSFPHRTFSQSKAELFHAQYTIPSKVIFSNFSEGWGERVTVCWEVLGTLGWAVCLRHQMPSKQLLGKRTEGIEEEFQAYFSERKGRENDMGKGWNCWSRREVQTASEAAVLQNTLVTCTILLVRPNVENLPYFPNLMCTTFFTKFMFKIGGKH